MTPLANPQLLTHWQRQCLLFTAAVSSGVGLAAELLLGTLASYLVGNHALAYGLTVGGFLAAMGIGAYLSKFVADHGLLSVFFAIELALAPLVGLLPLALFALFTADGPLWLGLIGTTLLLGTLAGMEVPLLTRLVELRDPLRDALAGVLALDYLGALVGALLFPAILLPWIGLFPSAMVIGALPAVMVMILGQSFRQGKYWRYAGLTVALALFLGAPATLPISHWLENTLYRAPVVWRQQTRYQRMVVTRRQGDMRLFLDGDLQLSTVDEYRYHESLIHPAMAVTSPHRVLLLGAGDGLALREVLKWPTVEQVTMIELDPAIVAWGRRALRADWLDDERVTIRYGDAFRLVPQLSETFDVIVADFPDPDQVDLAKLYSVGFYRQVRSHLTPNGLFVTQASSPFFAPNVLACIQRTLTEAGFFTYPYRTEVPSFGLWGFVLAAQHPQSPQSFSTLELPIATRFLTTRLMSTLFIMGKDLYVASTAVRPNRLSDPVIVRYQHDPRWTFY